MNSLYYGSGSGSSTVINYGSGSDFLARYGSGSEKKLRFLRFRLHNAKANKQAKIRDIVQAHCKSPKYSKLCMYRLGTAPSILLVILFGLDWQIGYRRLQGDVVYQKRAVFQKLENLFTENLTSWTNS